MSKPNVFFEPWLKFKTPIVRQLAFCIASTNIISKLPHDLIIHHPFELHEENFWQQQYQAYEIRLFFLDHNPTELHDFLNQLKSTRLGLRFEYLLWFWLRDQNYHDYELIDHSIQIIEHKNTIGEIDFLVKNKLNQQIEHWEVALKYYLGEANLSLKNWYGLNRDDTLIKKLNHFTQKQFQFSSIKNIQIDRKIAVLKGQFFLPFSYKIIPDWINLNRRLGHWGHTIPDSKWAYARLSRHEWLCPNKHNQRIASTWWSNDLFYSEKLNDYYMYRNHLLITKQHN